MDNKKLKQKIAACLISNELAFLGENQFPAGLKVSHSQMVEGLVNFVLGMIAREEDKNSKAELKKGILVYLKKRQER